MTNFLDEMEKTADELIQKSLNVGTSKEEENLQKGEKQEDLEPDDVFKDEDDDDEDDEDDELDDEDDEDDDDEDDEDDELDDEDDEDEEDEDIKKSFFNNEVIQESINVSDFLMAMSEVMANSASTMSKSLKKSEKTNEETVKTLSKAFSAIGRMTQNIQARVDENKVAVEDVLVKSVESIMERLDEVCDRLEGIEAQPGMRKSLNSPQKIKYQDKNFQKSLGMEEGTLSKSQISDALTTLSLQGAGISPHAVVAFESGGQLSPELQARVNEYYNR